MAEKRNLAMRFATGLLVVFIALFCVTAYGLKQVYNQMIAGLCGVTVKRILPAPDAKRVLVSYVVGCGATTPFTTQMSMLPSGVRFSRESYPPFFRVKDEQDLTARWVNDSIVEITIPQNAEVYARESSMNGITIRYNSE